MDIKKDIYSFWGRRNVVDVETDVSDYLVKVPGTDLQFALKQLDNDGDALKEYKAKLAPIIQLRGAPKVPLAVVTYNDSMQARLGVIVRWQFGTPVLDDSMAFISMTEEMRARLYDEIKSSDQTIRILETSNCKVVKHLKITEECSGRLFHAEIVYLRDLSLSYRMKSKDNLSDIERFEYYYKGIPQKDYPFDKLDEGIVKAINVGGYKKVNVTSQLLLFSSELRDLNALYGRRKPSKVEFLVLPDYSSIHLMVGRTFKPFYLDMFIDIPNNFTYQNKNFTISIPLNNVNDYYDFIDGTKTLCSVTQFLSR